MFFPKQDDCSSTSKMKVENPFCDIDKKNAPENEESKNVSHLLPGVKVTPSGMKVEVDFDGPEEQSGADFEPNKKPLG